MVSFLFFSRLIYIVFCGVYNAINFRLPTAFPHGLGERIQTDNGTVAGTKWCPDDVFQKGEEKKNIQRKYVNFSGNIIPWAWPEMTLDRELASLWFRKCLSLWECESRSESLQRYESNPWIISPNWAYLESPRIHCLIDFNPECFFYIWLIFFGINL